MKSADKLYSADYPDYKTALDLYLRANSFNPNNAELNFKIGKCYFERKNFPKATEYLEKAKSLDEHVDLELNFLLAKCYHIDYKFDKAIDLLIKFRQTLDPQTIKEYEKAIEKEINECKTGKKLVANPVRVYIKNLGPAVNTKYPDYSSVVNADNSILYFTSMRPSTTGGGIDEIRQQYFEDIYI